MYFCSRESSKSVTQVAKPTQDELIDRKLLTFKYPRHGVVLEYWDRPLRLFSTKSDDLWDAMQYCFEQFNVSLKSKQVTKKELL